LRLKRPPQHGGQVYERDDAPHRGGGDFLDEIECGDGNDTVRKDAEDIATNCETVEVF
jgi:hypothetical protein